MPWVPDFAGRDESVAREALLVMGANVTVTRRYAAGAEAGQVIGTMPAAGEPLTETVEVAVAATPHTAYLATLRGTGGCSNASAAALVKGVKREHSVYCSGAKGRTSETYWLLNRRTATLIADVGVEDRSGPESQFAGVERVAVLGDSFSAGDGAYRDRDAYADTRCRASDTTYTNVLFPGKVDNFA